MINTTTKQARIGDSYAVDGSFGSGPLYRGTFDINKQINDTAAFRITGMASDQKIVGRDGVKSDRWGIGASLGIGIGTDQSWYLNYFHQSNDRTPDFGVPMIGQTATTVRRPVTEFGIHRSFYYGKDTDRDRSDVDMLTSRYRAVLSDWLTFTNDTRVSFYDRYFSTTTATCPQACADTFFAGGNPLLTYGAGGGPTYRQTAWSLPKSDAEAGDPGEREPPGRTPEARPLSGRQDGAPCALPALCRVRGPSGGSRSQLAG